MPRQRGFGEEIADAKGAVVVYREPSNLVNKRQQRVHANITAKNFCVGNPDDARHVRVGERLEVGRTLALLPDASFARVE